MATVINTKIIPNVGTIGSVNKFQLFRSLETMDYIN